MDANKIKDEEEQTMGTYNMGIKRIGEITMSAKEKHKGKVNRRD